MEKNHSIRFGIIVSMSSLIKKVIGGDKSATVTFYKTHAPKINAYLSKRLPHETVEEVLQDIFLEAIDGLNLLKREDCVLQWLYKIAHHKVVDFYRKKKMKYILFSQLPFLQIIDREVHEPEFIFEKNKIRDKIEKTFCLLPYHYQRILKLHYENEIPLKQIAAILNLSFKTAESLLYRARQKFRKTYERTRISYTT